jgi:HD-GYP domain-containing protein (c-di-GMP phosphodiesterase class II)
MRRAALLHDIGKLFVPNTILEKPGALDGAEWEIVKQHPHYSYEILRRVTGFEELSEVAAAHHEKLDGSGYFRHLDAQHLSLKARILVVADIFDALSARRPYREAMPLDEVFGAIRKDAPRALDARCVEALATARIDFESTSASLQGLSRSVGIGKRQQEESREVLSAVA